MNRALVEDTTHPEALAAVVDRLGDPWPAHAAAPSGVVIARGAQADVNLADWSRPFSETQFPDTDVRIATRLGVGDRIARFPEPFRTPFDEEAREVRIPEHMAVGAGPDEEASEVTVSARSICFRFGTRRFRYDRLGLRVDVAEVEEEDTDA